MTAATPHRRKACLLAVTVLAGASAALPGLAGAQEGWETTIVAAAPLQPARASAAPAQMPKRSSRPAAAIPAPVAAPPVAAKSDAMPPLTVIAAQAASAPERGRPLASSPDAGPQAARDYCLNIADAATDARFAWQKKTIAELEQEIAKRVAQLEAKTAEYQQWLARREEFSKKAQASVVTIYARMKPDAAAAQLVAMDEETAAAVLTKLDPRNASAILNEMDAGQAARLTATISGAANLNLPGRPKAPVAEKKS